MKAFFNIGAFFFTSLLVTSEPACAIENGKFEASAQGQNGPVTVSTTFSQGKISSVKIISHKETMGIGEVAAPIMADRITKAKSLSVDVVSGATATSNAVLNATKECILKAKGQPRQFSKKDNHPVDERLEAFRTDLLVIGGGGAGMISAINAADHGVHVTLVEKMEFLGGASGICAGGMLIEGSELQKKLGVTDDSPQKFIADMLTNGAHLNNKATLEVYANHVGQTVDWLVNKGVQLQTENGVQKRAEFKTPRMLLLEGGCPGYAQTLRELVSVADIDVMLGTRVTDLLVQDGKVVGALAQKGRTKYIIHAQAVILATGGYGANQAMLPKTLKKTLYYGPVSSTGDGHRMAQKIGAPLQLMPYAKIYYNGLEVAPGIAKSTLTGNASALNLGAIMVNQQGHRVVNEKATGRKIVEAQKKSGGILFLVMDEPTFNVFRQGIKNNGVSEQEVDKWLARNGASAPIFAHGSSLEEAAKQAGINPTNLRKTIEQYNQFVADKKDAAFGRKEENMKAPIEMEGNLYIVEQKPRFATTMGSVVVNDKMQVLDEQRNIIRGLYAAGEVANCVHGDDSAPAANVSWVATSAKIASDQACRTIRR